MDDIELPLRDDQVVGEMEQERTNQLRGVDLSALSEREREVLGLALGGLSARAIAERLFLTEATVRSHLSRIYAKLGVGGRVELLAQMNGVAVHGGAPSTTPTWWTRSDGDRRIEWKRAALGLVVFSVIYVATYLLVGALHPSLAQFAAVVAIPAVVALVVARWWRSGHRSPN